jgi:hypothetical protein
MVRAGQGCEIVFTLAFTLTSPSNYSFDFLFKQTEAAVKRVHTQ